MFKYIISCFVVAICLFACKSTKSSSPTKTKKIEKSTPTEKPVNQIRAVSGYDVK